MKHNQKEIQWPDNDIKEIFGLLIVQTTDDKTILRPIGGKYGNGINDAIEEMDAKYPGCKFRILEEGYASSQKYLITNGISADRLIWMQQPNNTTTEK